MSETNSMKSPESNTTHRLRRWLARLLEPLVVDIAPVMARYQDGGLADYEPVSTQPPPDGGEQENWQRDEGVESKTRAAFQLAL